MSNPGVITLIQKSISANKSFRVEDNLGESIHFHYNDIRIDLTIKELLYLSEVCDNAIYELTGSKNFNLDDFDGDFLNSYSQYLIDLEGIMEDTTDVGMLYYQTTNFLHLPVRRKMNKARAQKLLSKKKYNGEAEKKRYKVVLFNDNNTIMYGALSAAEQFVNNQKQPIRVLRMNFEGGKHSVCKLPWIPFLFIWNKKRLINVARKLALKVLK